jgi:integrase/recombinase XerD
MKVYLEPKEIALMETAATNLRDRLLVRTLFHLAYRVSEALPLRVEDVDFEQGTVVIQHLKTRLNLRCLNCNAHLGRKHVFCPGCGQKVERPVADGHEYRRQRTLPVDSETLEMLREYITRGGPVVKNGKRLIFGINRHRAWQIVTQCAERAGLPKLTNPDTGRLHSVSPHRLRDAFAVHAMKLDDSGDGLRLLQQHLGHASFNTTARYRKVAGDEHREWYRKLWSKAHDGAGT